MTPHVIRLRGHWTRDEFPDGHVRHSRNFGRPRTLDANETVWLVGSRLPGDGSVFLNEQLVGTVANGEPFAFEVTHVLHPRNLITIQMNAATAWDGEVQLEIRSA